MSFIRSFAGFALALVIGYAAGVLMCVDAYHLGQSSIVVAAPSGSVMTCLPGPQTLARVCFSGLGGDMPSIKKPGEEEICSVVQSESVP